MDMRLGFNLESRIFDLESLILAYHYPRPPFERLFLYLLSCFIVENLTGSRLGESPSICSQMGAGSAGTPIFIKVRTPRARARLARARDPNFVLLPYN